MPEQIDPARTADVDAVIEWEITGPERDACDSWQLTVSRGTCTCVRDGDADPDVSYRIAPVDFVKLITGIESGPKMFVFGKLRIRGNLMMAARVPSWFRIPTA
jgi:hypothetical protein